MVKRQYELATRSSKSIKGCLWRPILLLPSKVSLIAPHFDLNGITGELAPDFKVFHFLKSKPRTSTIVKAQSQWPNLLIWLSWDRCSLEKTVKIYFRSTIAFVFILLFFSIFATKTWCWGLNHFVSFKC